MVSIHANRTHSVPVKLSSEKPGLEGTVTSDGRTVPGALIVLYKAGETEVPVATGFSDEKGNYDLGQTDPGDYIAFVEAPVGSDEQLSRKSFSVTLEDKRTRLDIAFTRPAHVTGHVTRGGIRLRPGKGESTLLWTSLVSGGGSHQAAVQPDGTFKTTLEPGRYSVGFEDLSQAETEIPNTENAYIVLEL